MNPLTWNTNRSGNRSRVYGGWHNWLDQSGWRALDGGFREDSGRYVADRLPGLYSVPALATDSVEFEVSQRWDIFSKSLITDSPWSLEITPENVRPVSAQRDDNRPDQIIYPDAFADGIDLRYTVWIGRAPRVTREVVIRREPPGDHDIRGSWLIRSSNARVWVPSGRQLIRPWAGNVSQAILGHSDRIVIRAGTSDDNESLIRGSGVKPPKAWYYTPYGELVTTLIELNITIVAVDTVRVEKIIPRSFIREAFSAGATAVMSDDTSTFYPDPDSETTSVDGQVVRTQESVWSSLVDGTGTNFNDSSSLATFRLACWTATDYFWQCYRPLFLLDTSSLSGDVTSATMNAYVASATTDTPTIVGASLVSASPASNTALASSDFQTVGSTRLGADLLVADWGTGYKSWVMNAAGIAAVDTDGITKLAMRTSAEVDATAPTWSSLQNNIMIMRTADWAGTSNDPFLEVVYGSGGSDLCTSDCALSIDIGI